MAAFIASLGLYGLVSFIIEQRTKEIGIRKVFGASVKNIIYLLSGYFSKWILIANILAYPIAYYYMDKWLSNFAYGIKLNFWIFLSASLVSIFIIVLTTGFLSIKAANANPVESLKYE
jgi:putative ABC transport system permease protein